MYCITYYICINKNKNTMNLIYSQSINGDTYQILQDEFGYYLECDGFTSGFYSFNEFTSYNECINLLNTKK